MAIFYRESDIDRKLIKQLKVAVIGYGSQGHAHALNLRDSGVEVWVALPPTSQSRAKATDQGLTVSDVDQAAAWADVIMFCTPDVTMRHVYREQVAEHLRPGQTLLFAHGFNIHYRLIQPRPEIGVAMVSPKGPGQKLREEFTRGGGLAGLVAVHQDPLGNAKQLALSYGLGIGCSPLLESTFQEETETDLFGEQAVLCGGIPALIKAGFQTLVDAGYQPEAAYFECLHETKLIVDLLYEGGLSYMYHAISDTAEWGAYVAGDRVVNAQSRQAMKELLGDIQNGEFARKWIEEHAAGRPTMGARRRQERAELVEQVGKSMRAKMPFIHPKEPPSD